MSVMTATASPVIPALGAGIHALGLEESKAWIPGPSPGMTECGSSICAKQDAA
jgi:hypothetical protein